MIAVDIGLVLAPGFGALTGPGGKSRPALFAFGVFTATALLAVVALLESLGAQVHTSGTHSKVTSTVSLGLGLLLVWFALKQWHKRPSAGHDSVTPPWMGSLGTVSGPKAIGHLLG